MKVLIATGNDGSDNPSGSQPLDGELLYVPEPHGEPSSPAFAGLASGRLTTTAAVVDRLDLTSDDLSIALADGLSRRGWLDEGWTQRNEQILADAANAITRITDHVPDGAVIERTGDAIRVRSPLTGLERLDLVA